MQLAQFQPEHLIIPTGAAGQLVVGQHIGPALGLGQVRQRNRLYRTAVVDDDYPEVRHDYEGALRKFMRALKANGRDMVNP